MSSLHARLLSDAEEAAHAQAVERAIGRGLGGGGGGGRGASDRAAGSLLSDGSAGPNSLATTPTPIYARIIGGTSSSSSSSANNNNNSNNSNARRSATARIPAPRRGRLAHSPGGGGGSRGMAGRGFISAGSPGSSALFRQALAGMPMNMQLSSSSAASSVAHSSPFQQQQQHYSPAGGSLSGLSFQHGDMLGLGLGLGSGSNTNTPGAANANANASASARGPPANPPPPPPTTLTANQPYRSRAGSSSHTRPSLVAVTVQQQQQQQQQQQNNSYAQRGSNNGARDRPYHRSSFTQPNPPFALHGAAGGSAAAAAAAASPVCWAGEHEDGTATPTPIPTPTPGHSHSGSYEPNLPHSHYDGHTPISSSISSSMRGRGGGARGGAESRGALADDMGVGNGNGSFSYPHLYSYPGGPEDSDDIERSVSTAGAGGEFGASQLQLQPSPIPRPLQGYLVGQIFHVLKLGVWWTILGPLLLSVFHGHVYGIALTRMGFNTALMFASPLAAILVERVAVRSILLWTVALRGLIYSVGLPLTWVLLESDWVVAHGAAGSWGAHAARDFGWLLLAFTGWGFLDGLVVAASNVVDLDCDGAALLARQHLLPVRAGLTGQFAKWHEAAFEASMIFLAPLLALVAQAVCTHWNVDADANADANAAGQPQQQKLHGLSGPILLFTLGGLFLACSAASFCAYLSAIPTLSPEDFRRRSGPELEELVDQHGDLCFVLNPALAAPSDQQQAAADADDPISPPQHLTRPHSASLSSVSGGLSSFQESADSHSVVRRSAAVAPSSLTALSLSTSASAGNPALAAAVPAAPTPSPHPRVIELLHDEEYLAQQQQQYQLEQEQQYLDYLQPYEPPYDDDQQQPQLAARSPSVVQEVKDMCRMLVAGCKLCWRTPSLRQRLWLLSVQTALEDVLICVVLPVASSELVQHSLSDRQSACFYGQANLLAMLLIALAKVATLAMAQVRARGWVKPQTLQRWASASASEQGGAGAGGGVSAFVTASIVASCALLWLFPLAAFTLQDIGETGAGGGSFWWGAGGESAADDDEVPGSSATSSGSSAWAALGMLVAATMLFFGLSALPKFLLASGIQVAAEQLAQREQARREQLYQAQVDDEQQRHRRTLAHLDEAAAAAAAAAAVAETSAAAAAASDPTAAAAASSALPLPLPPLPLYDDFGDVADVADGDAALDLDLDLDLSRSLFGFVAAWLTCVDSLLLGAVALVFFFSAGGDRALYARGLLLFAVLAAAHAIAVIVAAWRGCGNDSGTGTGSNANASLDAALLEDEQQQQQQQADDEAAQSYHTPRLSSPQRSQPQAYLASSVVRQPYGRGGGDIPSAAHSLAYSYAYSQHSHQSSHAPPMQQQQQQQPPSQSPPSDSESDGTPLYTQPSPLTQMHPPPQARIIGGRGSAFSAKQPR